MALLYCKYNHFPSGFYHHSNIQKLWEKEKRGGEKCKKSGIHLSIKYATKACVAVLRMDDSSATLTTPPDWRFATNRCCMRRLWGFYRHPAVQVWDRGCLRGCRDEREEKSVAVVILNNEVFLFIFLKKASQTDNFSLNKIINHE
jgi:hypothetical protein